MSTVRVPGRQPGGGRRPGRGGGVERLVVTGLGADRDAEPYPRDIEDRGFRRRGERLLAVAQVALALDPGYHACISDHLG